MLVLPVLAAFATSLMVARAGLLIADFPEFSENTLTGKSDESSNLPGGAALTWGAVWCPCMFKVTSVTRQQTGKLSLSLT